ncbi:MAG: hypothetical protein ACAH17_02690, partial [Candidatus Paceibacterota bacterium]
VDRLAASLSSILAVPHFHGHSFRIGAASSLALSGYTPTEIKSWGDWRSKAYLKYIRSCRTHLATHDPIQFFPPCSRH